MKAWQVHELGEPRSALRQDEVPVPDPGPGQVLVRTLAASANFPDVLMCRGAYQVRPSLPFTPGVELCGEIVAIGDQVIGFAAGDRVIGGSALPYGGFAEYAIMDSATISSAPEALDDATAAAFYITYQTGWFGLHRRARLQRGEALLVHAAAGGVGSAAVQLGATAGARVTATVRNAGARDTVRELGADEVIGPEDFGQHGPFDVILELVGGPNLAEDVAALAIGGRIAVIGVGAGASAQLDLRTLMQRRGRISASTLRARPLEEKATLAREMEKHVLPLVAAGRIRVPVAAEFGLDDAPAAYEFFSAGGKVGKVVLCLGG
jgi:NADPH:quinone reductase